MSSPLYLSLCLTYPVKEKKNTQSPCAVRRLILLSQPERIKTIRFIGMFIGRHANSRIMGNSHTGQQRFVTAAYRYLIINGPCSSHELVAYLHDNHRHTRNLTARRASCLMAVHPMFVRLGDTDHNNGRYKYKVTVFGAVPEKNVVWSLYCSIKEKSHIMFSFNKYPAFIRQQVEAMLANDKLHSTNNTPNEIETLE